MSRVSSHTPRLNDKILRSGEYRNIPLALDIRHTYDIPLTVDCACDYVCKGQPGGRVRRLRLQHHILGYGIVKLFEIEMLSGRPEDERYQPLCGREPRHLRIVGELVQRRRTVRAAVEQPSG